MQNKKAAASVEMIMGIALVSVAFFLIVMIFQSAVNKADSAAQESLCESFNALSYKTSIEPLGYKFKFGPDACVTIDKGNLPEEGYPQTQEGVKQNIATLMAKCWKMWLEGKEENIFAKTSWSDEPCFICYTFSIDNNIDAFTMRDQDVFMSETVYFADDTSDKCVASDTGYGGGYCLESCTDEHPKETTSSICKKENKKCCISSNGYADECVNKGGRCGLAPLANEVAYLPPEGWKCADKNTQCYVEKSQVYTYLDYIQTHGGTGTYSYNGNLQFQSPGEYAITFISPNPGNGFLYWTTRAAIVVATGAAIYFTAGLATPLVATVWTTSGVVVLSSGSVATGTVVTAIAVEAAAGTAVAATTDQATTTDPEINGIYIGPLSAVNKQCAIQAGANE